MYNVEYLSQQDFLASLWYMCSYNSFIKSKFFGGARPWVSPLSSFLTTAQTLILNPTLLPEIIPTSCYPVSFASRTHRLATG